MINILITDDSITNLNAKENEKKLFFNVKEHCHSNVLLLCVFGFCIDHYRQRNGDGCQ